MGHFGVEQSCVDKLKDFETFDTFDLLNSGEYLLGLAFCNLFLSIYMKSKFCTKFFINCSSVCLCLLNSDLVRRGLGILKYTRNMYKKKTVKTN